MPAELQPVCLIFALMFCAVLVIAGTSKYLETRRARHWIPVMGRVVESKVRSQRDPSSSANEFASMPLVVYEYAVDGQSFRGTRVNFAAKMAGDDIAPTLKKYPEGKSVQVYYDPANPGEAVLERDFPIWLLGGLAAVVLAILLLGLGLPVLLDLASRALAHLARQPDHASPATILGAMGGFALLIALAMLKQLWMARNWPTTTAKILDTSVAARDSWDSQGRYTPLYNSEIVYSFVVGGEQYISDRVALGGTIRSSVNCRVPGSVRASLAKYPEGRLVTVYYNPQNPSDCALERRANGLGLMMVIAATLIGVAVWMLEAY